MKQCSSITTTSLLTTWLLLSYSCPVYQVHMMGKGTKPVVSLDESRCPDRLLTIPATLWSADLEFEPIVIYYGDGLLVCGGIESHPRDCQYWEPGQADWIDARVAMNHEHRSGGHASFGGYGGIVVGHWDGAKTELLRGGAWREAADYPIPIRANTVIARSEDIIYSFGGYSEVESGPHPYTARVYRYDVVSDVWIRVQDMPNGGTWPNCGWLPSYRGREVVLCFGTEYDGGQGQASMDVFDVAGETWESLGRTAPVPPYYGSKVITLGGKLYRLRGIELDTFDVIHTLDVFDSQTDEWEPTQQLEGFGWNSQDGSPSQFTVVLRLKVINTV